MKLKNTILILIIGAIAASGQSPFPFPQDMENNIEQDALTRYYLTPQRVVWTTSDTLVKNAEVLLKKGNGQPYFGKQALCKITNSGEDRSGIILDFGLEFHGGIQITTSQSNNVTPKVRLRFGESVSEVNSDAYTGKSGYGGGMSTNHHAMRDFELTLPGYGSITIGNTGFRFVRIDLVDRDASVVLKEVRGVAVMRNIPYLGSFKSSDERLNNIWKTGAYTVHLCMQDYLWDGIKRDRMVWAGDMHPEMMTINAVFGYNKVVPKTLDFLKETTPLPKFMNGIPSYSMWWIIMQHDWYLQHGDQDYLQQQKEYLLPLLEQLSTHVTDKGEENLYKLGMRFIDWPTYRNSKAVHAGLQALMVLTFDKGANLCQELGEKKQAKAYQKLADKMRKQIPAEVHTKQAASLLSLSGMMDARTANSQVIATGGAENFSTFFGYYMLQAMAKSGDYEGAIEVIRNYWGGMLDLGATTFWEEFDVKEAENAAPINEFVPNGKLDYHKDTGKECYIGLRRSLCHGWASGPTAWLSQHVLGIEVIEPGCKTLKIEPHLGNLQWVEGSYPTPLGVVKVRHEKQKDGSIHTQVEAPERITILN